VLQALRAGGGDDERLALTLRAGMPAVAAETSRGWWAHARGRRGQQHLRWSNVGRQRGSEIGRRLELVEEDGADAQRAAVPL
jgi:hypothetical protein